MKRALLLGCVLLAAAAAGASAKVTTFQNGVGPTKDYAGCVDTKISVYNDAEARGSRTGEGKTANLRTFSTARRILVRFDISALPKADTVRKALLRVYCAAPTGLTTTMTAAPLTHEWDDTATGFEFHKTDDDASAEGNWTTKGGDYDKDAEITSTLRAGPFGHAFEFDVTALVTDWLSGKRPDYGVILWSGQYTEHQIASSEWLVAEYRPALLVDHCPAADAGKPAELAPLPGPPKDVPLSPVAQTADAGKPAGEYATVRIGLNANCDLREGTWDGYEKEWPPLAGRWDWMPMLRVGGSGGDFNLAGLAFDLAALKGASIRSAKLRLCVVDPAAGAGVRFGVCGSPVGEKWDSLPLLAVASFARPSGKQGEPATWIEWDLTGAARSAAGGKMTLLITHDVEGGAFDAYSSKCDDPTLRPYLEVEVSPAPKLPKLAPLAAEGVPAGDYWVEPMRKVHERFKGKPGSLAQYGDSITVTQAYIEPHYWAKSVAPEKCDPADAKLMKVLDTYADKKLWRNKGPEFGCNGNMTVAWLYAHIDEWQKAQQPEVAVILFGTNDVSYGPVPPDYTELMAASIDRMLADGTIPILFTLPPRGDQKNNARILARVQAIRTAQIAIARARKIPLIDFYDQIVRRQPEDWDKTLMGDTLHPSYRNPWKMDFTAEGLTNSGYTLRNYLTFMKWADIVLKVLKPASQEQ